MLPVVTWALTVPCHSEATLQEATRSWQVKQVTCVSLSSEDQFDEMVIGLFSAMHTCLGR